MEGLKIPLDVGHTSRILTALTQAAEIERGSKLTTRERLWSSGYIDNQVDLINVSPDGNEIHHKRLLSCFIDEIMTASSEVNN